MKVLITGRGGNGSWTMRGEQLGAAIGATVKPMATSADCQAADLVVIVKRAPEPLLQAVRLSGRPWVYDIVDAYPQPACSRWTQEQSREWLRTHLAHLRPSAVIWPTLRMAADYGGPGFVLYHHARPGQAVNPIRPLIETIGYEGREQYLHGWQARLALQAARIGARLVVNPARLADVDVVLALRGGEWNGYAQRSWKSNVKLANAHATGTPFIGLAESGYLETLAGGEQFIDEAQGLVEAFDRLAAQSVRRNVSEGFLAAAYSLEAAAADMRAGLCALKLF